MPDGTLYIRSNGITPATQNPSCNFKKQIWIQWTQPPQYNSENISTLMMQHHTHTTGVHCIATAVESCTQEYGCPCNALHVQISTGIHTCTTTEAVSPLELRTDVDSHRWWAILTNIMYFTVFEVDKWLFNDHGCSQSPSQITGSSLMTAKNQIKFYF